MHDTMTYGFDALDDGRITSSALTESALDAIERHKDTNAFITVDAEGARASAREAARERASGKTRGPVHGATISLKDIIDVEGVVSTAGSHVLDERVAPADAPVVTRLKNAGAVILGRTNLHEFAFGTTSEDSAYGPVRHPQDRSRVAGGSSGGSAVAVALGMGIASIGTDTGGSIRIPAAACGVVGLKATRGEIPTDGVIPLSTTLDHVGPLANSVQDAAWLWQVLASRPLRRITPASVAGLRIKRLVGYFDNPLDPIVRRAFETALDRLRDSGVSLSSGEVADTERVAPAYVNLVLAEAAHWHSPYIDTRASAYQPNVFTRIRQGRSVPAIDYLDALDACRLFERAVDAALTDCDALVLPTLPILAPLIGQAEIQVDPSGGAPLPIRSVMLKHTQMFNLSGHPAISLPIESPTLPVGLQLVGRRDRTEDLVAMAAACEPLLGGRRLAASS